MSTPATQYPKIIFHYSASLDEIVTGFSLTPELLERSSLFKKVTFKKVLTKEDLLEKRLVFFNAWKKYEDAIFKTMTELTGLVFLRNTIDIFLVRAIQRTFSAPIIMYAGITPDRFIQTLTHELYHLLLREGLGETGLKKIDTILAGLFPNETELTQSHVLIYALLSETYVRVFPGEERMKQEKEWTAHYTTNEYTRALELSQILGEAHIIQKVIEQWKK